MTDKIQIGKYWYTQQQIDVINELFGEGFLQRNPHFPEDGTYTYSDWEYVSTSPELLQEREAQKREMEEEERAEQEEDVLEQPTLMVACAEAGTRMGDHEEVVIAHVLGNSQRDCREKFVRQHLEYTGPDWEAKFKE